MKARTKQKEGATGDERLDLVAGFARQPVHSERDQACARRCDGSVEPFVHAATYRFIHTNKSVTEPSKYIHANDAIAMIDRLQFVLVILGATYQQCTRRSRRQS